MSENTKYTKYMSIKLQTDVIPDVVSALLAFPDTEELGAQVAEAYEKVLYSEFTISRSKDNEEDLNFVSLIGTYDDCVDELVRLQGLNDGFTYGIVVIDEENPKVLNSLDLFNEDGQ